MSDVVSQVAGGLTLDPVRPVATVTKLPMQLLNKVILGLKVGLGGTAMFFGAAVIILIIAAILKMVGVDLSSFGRRSQAALGF